MSTAHSTPESTERPEASLPFCITITDTTGKIVAVWPVVTDYSVAHGLHGDTIKILVSPPKRVS